MYKPPPPSLYTQMPIISFSATTSAAIMLGVRKKFSPYFPLIQF